MRLLGADRRVRAVSWIHERLVGKSEQSRLDGSDDLLESRLVPPRVARPSREQGVTRDQVLADDETGSTRRVAGRMENRHAPVTELQLVPVVQLHVDLDRVVVVGMSVHRNAQALLQ